jgi:hypothetical protein
MELYKDFDESLERIERDPRPAAKRMARQIVEQRLSHVPEEVAAPIVQSRLKQLAK